MKTILSFLPLLLLFVVACEKDDISGPTELVGTWRLVEILADPGDGSGTFQPVDSDRRISFLADETFTATGNVCNINSEAENNTTGRYFPGDNRLEPEDCLTIGGTPITYERVDRELIINYPCIEPCQHKYRKE